MSVEDLSYLRNLPRSRHADSFEIGTVTKPRGVLLKLAMRDRRTELLLVLDQPCVALFQALSFFAERSVGVPDPPEAEPYFNRRKPALTTADLKKVSDHDVAGMVAACAFPNALGLLLFTQTGRRELLLFVPVARRLHHRLAECREHWLGEPDRPDPEG